MGGGGRNVPPLYDSERGGGRRAPVRTVSASKYMMRSYCVSCQRRSFVAMWPQRSAWSASNFEHSDDLSHQNSRTSSTSRTVQPATESEPRHSAGTAFVTRQTMSRDESNERIDEPRTRAPRR